jgi:uncharacterized pyridoxamine 5'-phosphate oxidase family protein
MKGSHSYSILQGKNKICFITGRTDNLHKHHCFYGNPNRKISDKHGFWVYLTGEYHNQNSRIDVHRNKDFDLMLKRLCQEKYEEEHTREEFVALIGRSYL